MKTLLISETFSSIQGETTFAGRPCFFIRLAGCNLRCRYCDTKYAWSNGNPRAMAALISEYEKSRLPMVEVTGGEPLLQSGTIDLLKILVKKAERVLLETNGSLSTAKVPEKVFTILDVKCPGSGFAKINCPENLGRLRSYDEVKFVICGKKDYEWAKKIMKKYRLAERCQAVNFSAARGYLASPTLASWILKDQLPARLNLQIHKQLWPDSERGK